jgi:Spy/CpxP family protein refolding chaperone
MSRTVVIVALVLAAVVAVFAPAARAQNPASASASQPAIVPAAAPASLEAAIEMMNVPADKKAAAVKIFQAHRQAMAEWNLAHGQEVRDARAKMAAARAKNDPAAIEAAGEALGKLAMQQQAIKADSEKQLQQVLTKEQIDELHRLIAPRLKKRPSIQLVQSGQLNLTPEQNQAVEKILAEMKQASDDAKTPQAKDQALLDSIAKIMKVLTDEQRAKFQTLIGDQPTAESQPAGK